MTEVTLATSTRVNPSQAKQCKLKKMIVIIKDMSYFGISPCH